jgi:hypothetical protein
VVDRRRQIISDPPMIVPIEEVFAEVQADAISAQLRAVLDKYRRTLQSDRRRLLEEFTLGQVARKVVGVGSVGTRAWVVLMDSGDGEEPLFLQAKEAQPSVLAEYAGPTSTPTRAGESSPGSTCSRPRATSSSAEPGSPAPTGQTATITSASCGTGNSPSHRGDAPSRHDGVRPAVRVDPGPGARPLRRPHRPGRLPRRLPQVRPGHRRLRRKPTPTRTSSTTPCSRPPSKTARPKPPPKSKAAACPGKPHNGTPQRPATPHAPAERQEAAEARR